MSLGRLILYLTTWYNTERVLGIGSIFMAILLAFPNLYMNSLVQIITNRVYLNDTIMSHWFLFAGIFLLWKGASTTFLTFTLTTIPLDLIALGVLLLGWNSATVATPEGTYHFIGLPDMVFAFIVASIILQKIVSKMVLEALQIASEVEITPVL